MAIGVGCLLAARFLRENQKAPTVAAMPLHSIPHPTGFAAPNGDSRDVTVATLPPEGEATANAAETRVTQPAEPKTDSTDSRRESFETRYAGRSAEEFERAFEELRGRYRTAHQRAAKAKLDAGLGTFTTLASGERQRVQDRPGGTALRITSDGAQNSLQSVTVDAVEDEELRALDEEIQWLAARYRASVDAEQGGH